MKLENQVTNKEISNRLKELGVKQESYFQWRDIRDRNSDDPFLTESYNFNHSTDIIASAFTVAELGEMLPTHMVISSTASSVVDDKIVDWICESNANLYYEKIQYQVANTEADARGKMLIYLLENKLITI